MSKEFRHFIPESVRYTGREFEIDIFGSTLELEGAFENDLKKILSETTLAVVREILRGNEIPKEARKIVKESLKEIRNKKDQIIEIVKKYQKFDPTNPNTDFLRELRLAIADELGLHEIEEMEKIKVFSAIRSPLDVIGIDGFVTWQINGKEIVVTLDASLREKEFGEADIIFGELPDPKENEEDYLKEIEKIARKVAKIFKSRAS
jgi:hypothetical protein